MTAPKRIVRRAPPRPAPAATPSSPPQAKPAAPTPRVIPINASGELPKREEGQQTREGGSGVDHVAVIARYKGKITNRASAIRAHCIECSGGAISEVRNCAVTKCALYGFRNGEDPFRKKRTDGFVGRKNTKTEDDGEEE